jgi:hypothetical protein
MSHGKLLSPYSWPIKRGQIVGVLTVWATRKTVLPTLAHNLPTPDQNMRQR